MKKKDKVENKADRRYVSKISPKTNEPRSLLRAFYVGGLICVVGQFIRYLLQIHLGLYGDEGSVLSYWWYDADRVEELDRAMEDGTCLPMTTN